MVTACRACVNVCARCGACARRASGGAGFARRSARERVGLRLRRRQSSSFGAFIVSSAFSD
ncbi:hypothetical protein BURPS668_2106 [Burkholderia pseudomallei 668]|nr:hypothetical protein BURPS668_2106 [Burkholderia pseudomallei 668]